MGRRSTEPCSSATNDLGRRTEASRVLYKRLLIAAFASVPAGAVGASIFNGRGTVTSSFLFGGIAGFFVLAYLAKRALGRWDALRAEYADAMGHSHVLQSGERFSSGIVTINDDDTVYLESRLSPARTGWLRLIGSFFFVALGLLILWYGSWHGIGLKGHLAGWASIVLYPLFMAMPYTSSWGATRFESEGGPGLIFERYWLFFVPRTTVLSVHEIQVVIIHEKTQGGVVAELWAVTGSKRRRQLATGRAGTYEEDRLNCLRTAIERAIRTSDNASQTP